MPGRTMLQWDEGDCAVAGLIKFDLLGLGMLSAIHYALDLLRDHHGVDLDLARLPLDDPAVYDMLCAADSVGVFQVESRAQMASRQYASATSPVRSWMYPEGAPG